MVAPKFSSEMLESVGNLSVEAIEAENGDILPLEVLQPRCPTILTIRVEQHIGERIVGAVARRNLLDSSLPKVQHDVHLLAVFPWQDRSHLKQRAKRKLILIWK